MAKNKTTTGFLAKICMNNRITIPHLEAARLGLSTGTLVLVCVENVEP